MQTDPAYAQNVVRALLNSAALKPIDKYSAVTWTACDLLSTPGKRVRAWRLIETECQVLRYISFHCTKDKINLSTISSTLYAKALSGLASLTGSIFVELQKWLGWKIAFSRGFGRSYKFSRREDGSPMAERTKTDENSHFHRDPLHWCLISLSLPISDKDAYGYSVLFSFLEDQLGSSNQEVRSRVDQTLSQYISNMAAVYKIYATLHLEQPLHSALVLNKKRNDHRIKSSQGGWRMTGGAPVPYNENGRDELVTLLQVLSH